MALLRKVARGCLIWVGLAWVFALCEQTVVYMDGISGCLVRGSANTFHTAGRWSLGTTFLEVESLKMKKDIAVPLVGCQCNETVEQR